MRVTRNSLWASEADVQGHRETRRGDAEHHQRENHLEQEKAAAAVLEDMRHRASSWLSRIVAVSGW